MKQPAFRRVVRAFRPHTEKGVSSPKRRSLSTYASRHYSRKDKVKANARDCQQRA